VDDGIVPDQFDELHVRLLRAAEHADVVLTSGGVSVGDYDLVKSVLQQAGGIHFWQVAMQPGRPLAAGSIGRAHFFGLPGNPVASMLTFHLFVRPALWKLAGRRELFAQPFHATAAEPLSKKTGRREFKRGILSWAGSRWEVRTTGPQGSGILTSMTAANCFIVIEEERGDVEAGETVWVEPFQPL
jgi:molybdopterin molybdotransferase